MSFLVFIYFIKMLSIIEMPVMVMEKIIGFSDFQSVLTLRQVCQDFRNFIDDMNDSKVPDPKFYSITLDATYKCGYKSDIFLTFEGQNGSQKLSYFEADNSRSFKGKTTILENSNYVDVAIQDLEMVLKFQKIRLDRLAFYFEDFQLRKNSSIHTLPVKLSNMLGKLNRKIKTWELTIRSHIIQILKFADPKSLKILNLYSNGGDMEIDTDEIVKTEQWRNTKELSSSLYFMNLNVEDILHFSRLSLKTNSISAKDLDTLKNNFVKASISEPWEFDVKNLNEGELSTFVNSSIFEEWELQIKNYNEQEDLSNTWGPPFVSGSLIQWYFRMKESEKNVLRIKMVYSSISGNQHIYFDIIKMEEVPNGAIAHDYSEN
ncbi:unnamed protein product [Caenorhabditis nigoni]